MIDPRIEQALRSSAALSALRNLAMQLSGEGETPEAILGVFEQARQQLRQLDREADEDAVMDAMDFLVGWCSPHMKLPPKQPTTDRRG